LETLLSNPALGRKMGCAGRERILREFRSEIIWKALADHYEKALAELGIVFGKGEITTCTQ
jgi:hypothetical protein